MTDEKNPLGLKKIHHVEFYVGNAKQAEFYYRKAFGFSRVGYSGLETGNRETTQGKSENLGLSRFWGLLFWLFISAASGTEGLLVARLFSKIKEKNISATPFVIIFTVISVVGFSPISLMTIVGSLMVILFPIFTMVLLLITIIESLNSRFRKIN
jgi:hypothetical protein